MWDAKIVNRSDFSVMANGRPIPKNSDYTITYVGSGVSIQVGGVDAILSHNELVDFQSITIWRPDPIVDFANAIAKYNPATPS